MSTGDELHRRLRGAERPRGTRSRELRIGNHIVRMAGLDDALVAALGRRWGGFLHDATGGDADVTVNLFHGGPDGWLKHWRPGEHYRLEAFRVGDHGLVASYHFAIAAERDPRSWRLALTDEPSEPPECVVDNAMRYVVARLAVELGGFALHGAAVLRDGRAYIFAGPSRSGKSTAVELSAPAESLGDDFAIVLPRVDGWFTAALPFDNAESARHVPRDGEFPVACVLRLHQAAHDRVERPPGILAAASLMGCAAFPWALPESADRLLDQIKRFIDDGGFAHLHFRKQAAFWTQILSMDRTK